MSNDDGKLDQPLREFGRFIGRESASAIVGWAAIAIVLATALWTWQRGWSALLYVGLLVLGATAAAGFCWWTRRALDKRLIQERSQAARVNTALLAMTERLAAAQNQLAVSQASAETLVAIVQLDATLLNALSVLVAARDRQRAVRNILYEFLRDCSRILGPDLNRAFVIRPTLDGFLRPSVA